jgi:hypothetical protein
MTQNTSMAVKDASFVVMERYRIKNYGPLRGRLYLLSAGLGVAKIGGIP